MARQSGKMPEEDQQQMLSKAVAETDALAAQIAQRQVIENDLGLRNRRLPHPGDIPTLLNLPIHGATVPRDEQR